MCKIYGLIGNPVAHSFSSDFFNDLFAKNKLKDHLYNTYKLNNISEINFLLNDNEIKGLNITIPFKEVVIDYLDDIDKPAKEIGAINCIKISPEGNKGYNTDIIGFEKSLKNFINSDIKFALILGSGGASKAVEFVLKKLKIKYKIVSRSKSNGNFIQYSDLDKNIINKYKLIVNTTPLGTFPNIDDKPNIPYKFLQKDNLLYDLIYNPKTSSFLNEGVKNNCKIKNGQEMLEIQALESWKIWNNIV